MTGVEAYFARRDNFERCLKMSLKTLPLLFINLGGEMIYILDQRLRAQNIPGEKSRKGKLNINDKSINLLNTIIYK